MFGHIFLENSPWFPETVVGRVVLTPVAVWDAAAGNDLIAHLFMVSIYLFLDTATLMESGSRRRHFPVVQLYCMRALD